MAEVFISYARPDAQQAARVVEGLESAGYSLWWDSALAVSDDFGMRIEEELAAARCVVVAWSAAARHSLWVRAEATAVLEADKLVQVSLDAGKPPLPFTMLQLLDLSAWGGETTTTAWSRFEGAVRAITRKDAATAAAQAGRVVPTPRFLGPTVALGAASLGLVALSSTLVAFAARGGLPEGTFGFLTTTAFLLACITLGHMCTRVIQVAIASRRP